MAMVGNIYIRFEGKNKTGLGDDLESG